MTQATRRYADRFDVLTGQDWREAVERGLKDGDFERKLETQTVGGTRLKPIYPAHRGPNLQPEGRAGRWAVIQRICATRIEAANDVARAALNGGADGLELVFEGSIAARGRGIVLETLNELDRLLDDIPLDRVELRIDAAHHARHIAAMLVALARRREIAPSDMRLGLNIGAIGHGLGSGRIAISQPILQRRLKDMLCAARDIGMAPRVFTIESRSVHEAGGTEEQELAFFAAGVAHNLRTLEAIDEPLSTVGTMMGVRLAADSDQIMTIAKFRAVRRLWARILESCGVEPLPLHVHAETSWRMLTRYDPHTNILRNTMATFAAGCGGADSVLVLPFNMALGGANDLSHRLSRNTQAILLEESNIARVADPAAGAGAIEALTAGIAERAWGLFQEIEQEGGLLDWVRKGKLQHGIAEAARERMHQVATRQRPITGVTEFALADETHPVAELPQQFGLETVHKSLKLPEPGRGEAFNALIDAAIAGHKLADMAMARGASEAETIERAPALRLAEPFELLRDAAARHAGSGGVLPRICVIGLGRTADHQSRLLWLQNALAVGGLATKLAGSFTEPHEAGEALRMSGLPVACLCGSDEAYADLAAPTTEALRTLGAAHVVLAGRPGEHEHDWRAAGISGFVYAGADLHAFLVDLHGWLGISEQEVER